MFNLSLFLRTLQARVHEPYPNTKMTFPETKRIVNDNEILIVLVQTRKQQHILKSSLSMTTHADSTISKESPQTQQNFCTIINQMTQMVNDPLTCGPFSIKTLT